jgi:hypothetical protein
MDKPLRVKRVTPPITTAPAVIPADQASHRPIRCFAPVESGAEKQNIAGFLLKNKTSYVMVFSLQLLLLMIV